MLWGLVGRNMDDTGYSFKNHKDAIEEWDWAMFYFLDLSVKGEHAKYQLYIKIYQKWSQVIDLTNDTVSMVQAKCPRIYSSMSLCSWIS